MEEKNYAGLIPDEKEGWTITATTSKTLADEEKAQALFEIAAERMVDVNHWKDLLGGKLGSFQLTDAAGKELTGPARRGIYIKIDIAGPGTAGGDGFDWVHIEAVARFERQGISHVAMRVRPSSKPGSDDSETAHFYSDTSTSTFTVTREGLKIVASVYDRNTEINQEGENLLDKARNMIVGAAGILGFSKIQWKDLTDGLLD